MQTLYMHGKVMQTTTGVVVEASLRMQAGAHYFFSFWFSSAIIVLLFAEANFLTRFVISGVMALLGMIMVWHAKAKKSGNQLIALMNSLKNVKLPAPEQQESTTGKPRKSVTRKGIVYRYPKLIVASRSKELEDESSREH